ncbi:hypothetical protein [Candidatus Pristimantibacillus sp. PTI5]|uniref:hypothetical protein n=1 Tax=Candidatus Pristimantibacillus sp. PTI5 TaxID=3400422 RepID=UPI003B01311C
MKTKITFGTLVLGIALISGCDFNEPISEKDISNSPAVSNEQVDSNNKTNSLYSYEQFVELTNQLAEDIVIPGYEIKNYPLIPSIFIIEKELTFGKKDTLTVSGSLNDQRPVQQLFIFENKDQSSQIHIRLAFTNTDMGKELVSWDIPTGYDNTSEELSDNTDLATLTYRNLVITVMQNTSKKTNLDITKSAIRGLMTALESKK